MEALGARSARPMHTLSTCSSSDTTTDPHTRQLHHPVPARFTPTARVVKSAAIDGEGFLPSRSHFDSVVVSPPAGLRLRRLACSTSGRVKRRRPGKEAREPGRHGPSSKDPQGPVETCEGHLNRRGGSVVRVLVCVWVVVVCGLKKKGPSRKTAGKSLCNVEPIRIV